MSQEEQSAGDIKRSVATGAALMVMFKTLSRFLGLISTMILARILVPEDYGLIAMAMSFYVLIEIMAAMGFDVLLIQKDHLEKSDYDSAFSMKLVFYIVLSSLLFIAAPLAANFYEEPRLIDIIHVLSVSMFLTGIENIKMVDFRRKLEFKREFWFQLSVKIAGFVVTVPLAFIWGNYWALVTGMVVSRIASFVLSYVLIPYKPSLCFEKAVEFFHFSKWMFLTNILYFLDRKLPDFILGKLLGTSALGVYSLSSELANYPNTELCAPINRALFPGYSRLKNNLPELQKTYIDVLGILALIVLPIGFGLSATAEYVVAIILGAQWTAAVEPLQILSIAFVCSALPSNSGYIYYALGLPRISFYSNFVKMLVLGPLLFYMANNYGLMGAAYSYLIVHCTKPFFDYAIVAHLIKINYFKILGVQVRPFISSCAMYMVIQSKPVQAIISEQINVVVSLLLAVGIGVAVFVVIELLLWRVLGGREAPEKRVIDLGISMLRKK